MYIKKRTVWISMCTESVKRPVSSSTVVVHGMFPTYNRVDDSDMFFL